jgi:quercetin dioxygenase-like cupin family protein
MAEHTENRRFLGRRKPVNRFRAGGSRWNKLACHVGDGREYWLLATTTRYRKGETQMSATFRLSPSIEGRPFYLAIIAGLACAFVIGKALPSTIDAVSAIIEPLCANSVSGSTQDVVEPISSHALPNVPGKRVTIVRVFYGPGGFTPAHRHAGSVTAYVTKGEIRSQLAGGPVETFGVGQSFFEPPGAVHLVSANASMTEPAELIAVFVADEGAQLTTLVK